MSKLFVGPSVGLAALCVVTLAACPDSERRNANVTDNGGLSDAYSDADGDTGADGGVELPDVTADAEPETLADADADAESETVADADAEPETDADADAEPETVADADAEPETVADADAEPETVADADAETVADADADADADVEPETVEDVEPETVEDADSETDVGPVAECGNGIPEGDEDCDEGGVDTATCNFDCTAIACGDGHVNAAAGEDCEEGAVDTPTCNANCTAVECGDGIVNAAAGEDCEEGAVDTATCNFDCTAVSCGDGIINAAAGEDCEEGAVDTATCNFDCTAISCGDGHVNAAAGEDCEEGAVDTATCDADCTVVECGDGVANAAANEDCDGGGVDTATCNADCTAVECGDGYVNVAAGEQCDGDGAGTGGVTPTCDVACKTTAGWCTLPPQTGAPGARLACIFPSTFALAGGTWVNVSGQGFTAATTLTIGGQPVDIVWRSATELSGIAPPGPANTWVDVTVSDPAGGETRAEWVAYATHFVTSTASSGPGSITTLASTAQSGDFIGFDRFTAGQPITIANFSAIPSGGALIGLGPLWTVFQSDAGQTIITATGGTRRLDRVALKNAGSSTALLAAAVDLTVTRTLFQNNLVDGDEGGALHFYAGGNLVVRQSAFVSNRGAVGGAVRLSQPATSATFENVSFALNQAISEGGGIFTDIPTTVTACTFVNNSAPNGGGAIRARFGQAGVAASAFDGNGPTALSGDFSSGGYNAIDDVSGSDLTTSGSDLAGGAAAPLDLGLSGFSDSAMGLLGFYPAIGSILIDRFDPATYGLTSDIRDYSRPNPGSTADTGCVEAY